LARWKKLLERMLSDLHPTSYSYEDAAAILAALGFVVAPTSGGSHRKWRFRSEAGNVIVIGLVQKGRGTLKPYLIRDMLKILRESGLIPADLEK
jgi:hypothetical protein